MVDFLGLLDFVCHERVGVLLEHAQAGQVAKVDPFPTIMNIGVTLSIFRLPPQAVLPTDVGGKDSFILFFPGHI